MFQRSFDTPKGSQSAFVGILEPPSTMGSNDVQIYPWHLFVPQCRCLDRIRLVKPLDLLSSLHRRNWPYCAVRPMESKMTPTEQIAALRALVEVMKRELVEMKKANTKLRAALDPEKGSKEAKD
jgi:hypothetical protein